MTTLLPGREPPGLAVDRAALGSVSQDEVEDRVQVRLLRRQLDAARGPSSIAGSSSLRQGREPYRSCAASSPATAPGTAQEPAPIQKTCCDVASKSMSIDSMCGFGGRFEPWPGTDDEEVEQAVAPVARPVDEQEPARRRAGERALGDPGGERRGEAGVDGVAALGEDLRPGLGGQPVASCNRPSHVREA